MSSEVLCPFILSGFKSKYVSEWDEMYKAICNYVAYVYDAHVSSTLDLAACK